MFTFLTESKQNLRMLFVDSISVRILNESSVLQAKGNKLILHTGSCKHVNKVSPYDKIHQISFKRSDENKYNIACSAGREILVTEVIDKAFASSFVIKMSDWISSIKVINDGSVVIITAHNLVALLQVNGGKAVVKQKLRCGENSTLYCSHIHGSTWDELVFFSGSALGELIVWKKRENETQIIHRQFLHNGVIFSIDYNENYLVTSSDDRSIKIFDVNTCNKSFQLIEKKQLFGHTSRVFVCRIINFDNEVKFLSAGEDSNLCVWGEKGELLSKKNISSSGIIWNLDYNEKLETVITCSSTGKLNRFRLRQILYEKHFQENVSSDKAVQAVKFKFLENGALVVIDNNMEVHIKPRMQSWILVDHPKTALKYIGMEVFKNRLFLAAKSSIVVFDYLENLQTLKFTAELEIKGLLPPSANLDFLRSVHPLNLKEVFVSDASGSCFVLDVDLGRIVNQFRISRSTEPWATSVAKFGDLWLIADRVGNLFLYKNDDDVSSSTPIQKLRKLHGKQGVTTIRVENNGFVKTTGNDGTVKTLFINQRTDPPTIEIHRCERTSVNWIEKVYNWNGGEYLVGFNDIYFTLFHNRHIVYEHRCGGRHRHWDVTLADNEGRVNLAYIQKKQLNFAEFLLTNFEFEANDVSWHTKDCNAVEMASNDNLMISGGEDTLMKVMSVRMVDGEVRFGDLAVISSHISSIKTFATFQDDDDLWIFSAGGRAQIVVTRLIEMKHSKEEVNYMLTNSLQNGNSKNSSFDPETRFTSVCYDGVLRNVYVACSDGFIRIFKLNKGEENSFVLKIITEHFYGKCILKIVKLEDFVLTMATDGYICFWHHDELSQDLKLIDKLKHNQSGINCFDIFKCDDGAFLVGTSGDDAGVFITEFTINKEKVNFRETIFSNEFHIAQVTGLKFTSRNILYTASIDQTICKLEIENKAMKLVDKRFTCISDVKGFVIVKQSHVAVFGAGLEVLPNFVQ